MLATGGIVGGGALLAAMAGTAEAATANDVPILNFALTLEYLEAEFYTEAVAMGALSGDVLAFARIVAQHERAHVSFLKKALGTAAVAKPSFNFRGTTENQAKFKATAQVLEDTGVKAYAGQAPLIDANAILAAALSVHSIEARHASWIRHINNAAPAPVGLRQAADQESGAGRRRRNAVHHRHADDDCFRRLSVLHRLAGSWGRRKGGRAAALALAAIVFAAGAAVADAREHAAPKPLSNPSGVSCYMAVLEPVVVRSAPSSSAKVVARLSTRTPEGTTNVVLALARIDCGGKLWIKARLPVLPNNTTGWISRDALGGYNAVNTHLVVSTSKFTATLYRLGKPIFTARVGVGQSRWPTPTGRFYIRNKLTKYSSPMYGPLAFGPSARSAVLTDWPAGGFIGIHGTNQPGLIPGRISHGCIRLRNGDILRLAQLMQPGTPLTIS